MFKSSPSVPVTKESGAQGTEGTTRKPRLKIALVAGAALFIIICIIVVVVLSQKPETQVQPSSESLPLLTGRQSKTGFQVESFTEGPSFVKMFSGTPLHGLVWRAYNNPHLSIPILIGVILVVILAITIPLVLVLDRSKVPEIERQPDQDPVTLEEQESPSYMGGLIAVGVVLLVLIIGIAFWFLKGKKLFGDQSEPELTDAQIKSNITLSFGDKWPYPTSEDLADEEKLRRKISDSLDELRLKIMRKGRHVPKGNAKRKLTFTDNDSTLAAHGEYEFNATRLIDLYAAMFDFYNAKYEMRGHGTEFIYANPPLIIYTMNEHGKAVACKSLEGTSFLAAPNWSFLGLPGSQSPLEVYKAIERVAADVESLPEKSSAI